MAEQGEVQLPTAREAMALAVKCAHIGHAEEAYLWLAIARELRAGSPAPVPVTSGGPLDAFRLYLNERVAARSAAAEDAPEATPATYGDAPEAVLEREYAERPEPRTTPSDLEDTHLLSRVRVAPVRPPAIPPVEYGVCENCGMDVHRVERQPGTPVVYEHDLSGQRVCPGQRTPEGDETFIHTYAWPAQQG